MRLNSSWLKYLTTDDIKRLDACVADEKYFNLKTYISGEGTLLSSNESETLGKTTAAINKLSHYYCTEFYDPYIYRTFIENRCLYDPYIVEFITRVFQYKYFKAYPTQLVPNPEWWQRSFWYRLLDPNAVPEEVMLGSCYRVVKGVHYRTAGINALTNRCYIRLHPRGRHQYPPFNIPKEYDASVKTIQMQVKLYLDEGKVRPVVLLDLVEKVMTCNRLARFYFIPILVFLLTKLKGALETGNTGILVNEDTTDPCDMDCKNCLYACSCANKPPRPPVPPHGASGCCPCKPKPHMPVPPHSPGPHYEDYTGKECYCIPDDGGSARSDYNQPPEIMGDCGEAYEGLPPEERELATRLGYNPFLTPDA